MVLEKMGKFDTWTITCNLCEWSWETCSTIMAKNPKCPKCNSIKCKVEKNEFVTIKKQGKIIDELGFQPNIDIFGKIEGENFIKTYTSNEPMIIIRKNNCSFSEELTEEDKKELIGKIDLIKNKLIRDIQK